MSRTLGLLLALFICYPKTINSSTCEKTITMSYLDTAANMITKAKLYYPKCETSTTTKTPEIPDCRKSFNEREALDCSDLLRLGKNNSGVYKIRPVSRINGEKPLKVYCDMETDGGGWTLIQRRGDFGRVVDYFQKDWKSYKEGFGEVDQDFWLGNDNIFALTNQRLYSARFDLKAKDGEEKYAHYGTFWIDNENYNFKLHIANYSGDAGDSLNYHNNRNFSTKDRDNDESSGNCAENHKGGWWFQNCHNSNLNGLYLRGNVESSANGVNWATFRGWKESLATSEIKIRPKNPR